MNSADIIIIGGGMAGLYAAYTIHKLSPKTSYLILEKSPKGELGGRAGTEMFYGKEVVTGAGVGRKAKDKLLYKLLGEMGLQTYTYTVNPQYIGFPSIDILPIVETLRQEYTRNPINTTFKQFATHVLGNKLYKQFILSAGYTDFENEDAYETLYHYGLEDNMCCWKAFPVPWKELIMKLYESIGKERIRFSHKVIQLNAVENGFSITTETGRNYTCNKVIIATPIDGIRQLLPSYPIYNDIQGQPFLRLYAKFNKSSIPILKEKIQGFSFLPHPLQKIIPMDADSGIYMIAYNDNNSTLALRNNLENTDQNKRLYESMLENVLNIPRGELHIIGLKHFYWNIGTHYYTPLNRLLYRNREDFVRQAQTPMNGILVVGESVSRNQGWTEGALESVKAVVSKQWINK